jgi:hypothetical protein
MAATCEARQPAASAPSTSCAEKRPAIPVAPADSGRLNRSHEATQGYQPSGRDNPGRNAQRPSGNDKPHDPGHADQPAGENVCRIRYQHCYAVWPVVLLGAAPACAFLRAKLSGA